MTAPLLPFIDERLNAMLANPEMWGGAESFEMQVLQLIELREVLVGGLPGQSQASLRLLTDEFYSFVRRRLPGPPPQPLSAIVGEDTVQIAALLGEFRSYMGRLERDRHSARAPIPRAPRVLGEDIVVDKSSWRKPRKDAA